MWEKALAFRTCQLIYFSLFFSLLSRLFVLKLRLSFYFPLPSARGRSVGLGFWGSVLGGSREEEGVEIGEKRVAVRRKGDKDFPPHTFLFYSVSGFEGKVWMQIPLFSPHLFRSKSAAFAN